MIEEFKLKRKKKINILPKLLIIFILIMVIFLTRATWRVYIKDRVTGKNLDEAQKDLEELRSREENLNNEINQLSTERGIDEEIKEKFRVVKPGEEIIVLLDTPETEEGEKANKDKNLWQKFLELF